MRRLVCAFCCSQSPKDRFSHHEAHMGIFTTEISVPSRMNSYFHIKTPIQLLFFLKLLINLNDWWIFHHSCADPEGGQGVRILPPEKSQKYRISYHNWSGSPQKSQSYQAGIQCWAITGTPAKRVRWRADDGLILVVFGSIHYLKKLDPLWKKSGSAHVTLASSARRNHVNNSNVSTE